MKTRVINLFVLIVGGIIIFNLTTNIIHLWKKRGGLSKEQQRLEELRTKNSRLQTQLEYVQSEEFVEKEAREKLGLAKEGEEVWVLPETIREIREIREVGEEKPNWKKWIEFFGF